MKIFLSGSSGFVARFLIPELTSIGHSIVGIDKRKSDSNLPGAFTFVEGNILDDKVVGTAMKGCDRIIHLAAEHHDFGVPEKLFYEVNVEGTHKLLKYAELYDIRSIIFYSSVAVYGNNQEPSHEGLPANPASPYGKSKLMVEEAIEDWCRRDKTRNALVLRPALVFGPHNYANMYKLISSISKRRYLSVGEGKNIKSIAYVENIVDATLFLMNRMKAGVEIYNYADSPQLEAQTIASEIAESLNVRLPRIKLPVGLALSLAYPFDLFGAATKINLPITSKRIRKFIAPTHHLAKKMMNLGFAPRFTTEEGLRKMVSWYVFEQSRR